METRAMRKRARAPDDKEATPGVVIGRTISCPKPEKNDQRLLKKLRLLKSFFTEMPPDIIYEVRDGFTLSIPLIQIPPPRR